ncbi:hypothetical protein [Mesorhizobium sp.]|uniref:hypothetical protein n=1 Tax=Mesorhizobium sp. TaxID=1871066 RepID=UPI0025BBFCF9|nr:hypothetical protein [Mesorhizobium sp.]
MFCSTGSFFNNPNAGGGGAPAFNLDGLGATGVWSMSRDLLSSFAGNARYTTATGVDSFKDQTGNGNHFGQGNTSLQPAVTTAGPNSRNCADFDGVDDWMSTSAALSTFIANNAGFVIVSCLIDTIGSNNTGTPGGNQTIFSDTGVSTGMELLSTGPSAKALNFDGNYDTQTVTIATATALVLTWRHDGGNLYISKNGGAEASVASGNTSSLTNQFQLGRATGAFWFLDGKIFEIATWSAVPDATTRDTIVSGFMTHIGAT